LVACRNKSGRQIPRSDWNRAIGFGVPREVFPASFLFKPFVVCLEYFELVFDVVTCKVILQCFAANHTTHATLAVLASENDWLPVDIVLCVDLGKD
jgi:hypothetical protein